MSGVTPREAQAHKDKGGEVRTVLAMTGEDVDVTHTMFVNLPNQDTPRPQWRLVPIPEPTVTIEVPKWLAVTAADGGLLLSREDIHAFRQACISATQGDAQAVES